MSAQQPETLQKKNSTQKKSLWKFALIIIIIIVAAIAFLFVWILSILGIIPVFWAAIVSAILVVVSIIISLIGPLVSRDKPIVVQVPYPSPPPPLPVQSSIPESISYRDIIGLPPPTDVKAIQQREQAVEEIYTAIST